MVIGINVNSDPNMHLSRPKTNTHNMPKEMIILFFLGSLCIGNLKHLFPLELVHISISQIIALYITEFAHTPNQVEILQRLLDILGIVVSRLESHYYSLFLVQIVRIVLEKLYIYSSKDPAPGSSHLSHNNLFLDNLFRTL